MNQIDRIKKRGILSTKFFSPEENCDFYISEERKIIWAVLLDLLIEFQRICENFNLTYYGICGTLLGAIRHNGFIPWDDDLDVAMPRSDYEKLKTLRNEFKYPYNLVWPSVESENGYSFLKLRNSETTAMPNTFSHLKIDQGIFIDIFPLDEVNEETYFDNQSIIKEWVIENSHYMKALKDTEIDKGKITALIKNNFDKIEELAQKDNGKGYDKIALRTIFFYPSERLLWRKYDFLTRIVPIFEELRIDVPVGWSNVLETNYGDWQKMPPITERGKWHANAIFDPYLPYTYYLNI